MSHQPPVLVPDLPPVPARQPLLDLPTVGLLIALYSCLFVSIVGGLAQLLPWWVSFFFSVVGFHLTFSVWHEAIHGTVSRHAWLNTCVGTLGAFPSFVPYQTMRFLHMHHHRYANDPKLDLDRWIFLQGPFWQLLFRYPEGMRRAWKMFQATHPPAIQAWSDHLQQSAVIVGLGVLVVLGYWPVVVWSWVIPRCVAIYLHAWIVNYLPHKNMRTSWYEQTRCFPIAWLAMVTLGQNYHAIHHLWPRFRWYEYARIFRRTEAFLRQKGVVIHRSLFDADVYAEFSEREPS